MASERRPPGNQAVDLLHQRSPHAPQRSTLAPATSQDSLALLQALLNTPVAPRDERRPPVTLRSIEPQRSARPARPVPTAFDAVLQRSSQVLACGALLVLGYWFARVPLNNWMHPWPAVPQQISVRPSPFAARLAPTSAPGLVAQAVPEVTPSSGHNTPAPLRASAVPLAISAAARADAPSATELLLAKQIVTPTLAVEAARTAPPADSSPSLPSPPPALVWPTIPPVQLGAVSKPSPAPVERRVAAQPASPAQPHSAATLPTRLIIPTLGLDVPIKQVFIVNNQWQVAQYAAGYLNGSGLPGVPGNLALSGHAGLYGAVFANLGALAPGEEIFVDAAGVRYRYVLRTASAVLPNQAEVLDSTETPTMTLITCTNWDTQRLIAQADYVDSKPVVT